MTKPYKIVKIVICEIANTWCEGEGSYHDMGVAITPKCKECYLYKDWKKSGLSIEEYQEQEGNELNGKPHENDSDVIRWS